MLSAIFGLEGTSLSPSEYTFFRDTDPWAFILFARNVSDRVQLRALTNQLRACVGREALIFIDQEGGRVQRMRPPHWTDYPSGSDYHALYQRDRQSGLRATYLGHRLIAHDLREVGVTASCAPVLDIPTKGSDPIISDRAFGTTPPPVIAHAHAAMAGLSAGGVATVIKHIPGHGRAEVDSHKALPVIRANSLSDDMEPFKHLNRATMAMTAHAVYSLIDSKRPITLSETGIKALIREEIGFDGLLMTDDLDMKALTGRPQTLARKALEAGCDVVLQCSGDMKTMISVTKGCHDLSGKALERARMAEWSVGHPDPFDVEAGRAELSALVGI
jgi:beta-N-acetylhexosaminidase